MLNTYLQYLRSNPVHSNSTHTNFLKTLEDFIVLIMSITVIYFEMIGMLASEKKSSILLSNEESSISVSLSDLMSLISFRNNRFTCTKNDDTCLMQITGCLSHFFLIIHFCIIGLMQTVLGHCTRNEYFASKMI